MILVDWDGRTPDIPVAIPIPITLLDPNIITKIGGWLQNNVGVTNTVEATVAPPILGILGGPYCKETVSENNDKLINIVIKNGLPYSMSLNFKRQTMGIDEKLSLSLSPNGAQIGENSSWTDNNGIAHNIKYAIGIQGIEVEWGKGQDNFANGYGFKLNVNLNPTEAFTLYNYSSSRKEENTTARTEIGWCLNSGLLALTVAAIMALPVATSAEGAATITSIASQEEISKKIAAVVGLIINSFLNKDSCDLEETQ